MFGLPNLQTIATKLAIAAVAVLGLLGAGGYIGYRMERSELEELRAADVIASQHAVQIALDMQKAVDAKNQAAAVADAQAQQKIVTQTITITKEIPRYVHDQIVCPGPTVGLARVLRAAAGGDDPASLDTSTGQSDDACSDVTPSEVAGWFIAYAAASRANSEQLNALESSVRANEEAISAATE